MGLLEKYNQTHMKLKSIEEIVTVLRESGVTEYIPVIIRLIELDRQHLLQTIRKEVEGKMKDCGAYKDKKSGICRVCDYTPVMRETHNQALQNILTLLTTLEEEVSK